MHGVCKPLQAWTDNSQRKGTTLGDVQHHGRCRGSMRALRPIRAALGARPPHCFGMRGASTILQLRCRCEVRVRGKTTCQGPHWQSESRHARKRSSDAGQARSCCARSEKCTSAASGQGRHGRQPLVEAAKDCGRAVPSVAPAGEAVQDDVKVQLLPAVLQLRDDAHHLQRHQRRGTADCGLEWAATSVGAAARQRRSQHFVSHGGHNVNADDAECTPPTPGRA